MPFRYSMFAETVIQMREQGNWARSRTESCGSISRASTLCRPRQPWMLSKSDAGGGALLNLGIHGFDVCRYLTAEEPRVVSAVTSRAIHNQRSRGLRACHAAYPQRRHLPRRGELHVSGHGWRPGEKDLRREGFRPGDDGGRRGCAIIGPVQRDAEGPRGLLERLAEGRQRMSRPNRT